MAQAIIISTMVGWMAAAMALSLITVVVIQKFYLRTSRQLRLLDIELKADLYTSINESLAGLTTIRAFKWQAWCVANNRHRLDRSQTPMYLLFCIQRWLNLVLELLVAGIATLLVGISAALSSSPSAVAVGVSLINIMGFSQNLTNLVTSWVALETSLGAILRVKHFIETTPQELNAKSTNGERLPDLNGVLSIRDLFVSYGSVSDVTVAAVSLTIDQ